MKKIFLATAMILVCGLVVGSQAADEGTGRLYLRDGWSLQSGAKVQADGAALSQAGFKAAGFYPATVPNTVLAILVGNKVYPDPFFGKNLAAIPGNFPPPEDRSSSLMKPDSPFRDPWWYRADFNVPANYQGKKIWLNFSGLNFRANLWVNGKKIADAKDVAGPFRMFEFDVTPVVKPGAANGLAVEVFAPDKMDLAFTWVDWNPAPPDRDMGLWREVFLTATGPVAVRFPQVLTDLDLPSLEVAHLTVSADLVNASDQPIAGTLQGEIGDLKFSQDVQLRGRETRTVFFTPEKISVLNIKDPKLWWPAKLGPQNLHTLTLTFQTAGSVSDRSSLRFGIRKVTSELTDQGARLFKINGKNILIRGGGWTPDIMLRHDPRRMAAELRYALEMNLNTIRSEGKLEFDLFYDLADEMGILIMPGWCCCDHWERWASWDDEDYRVAEASLRDQVRRLRSHPSVFVWLNGSDNPPPPNVEKIYLKVLENHHWPNPVVSSATERPTIVSGKSGVKMNGPYEWVPPVYWYEDTKHGGAWGFNTETSPGPAVPPIEGLRDFLPPDRLWPINDYWNYHCGRGQFGNLRVFTNALEKRYGEAKSAEDYALKAQAMTYEAQRAMFEAFGRNKYTSTGVIQWMFNNGWPSLIWHLYDVYLRPGGGFFGTKKACEPLHLQYSYDDRSIVIVNSYYREFKGIRYSAKMYDFNLVEKFKKEGELDVTPDSSTRVFVLPAPAAITPVYFLRLKLTDLEGRLVSDNFYWLSAKPDSLNWLASTWFFTPQSSFADYSQLSSLPKVELKAQAAFEQSGGEGAASITLENPGPGLAFMVHLKLLKGEGGKEVLPIFWDDNYFPLFPGEKRELNVSYGLADLEGKEPVVAIEGWNVKAMTVK